MADFYTDVIVKDPRFVSVDRVADVALLEPTMRENVRAILAAATAQGLSLMVFETYRSQQRQHDLFVKGQTQLAHVGVHHYGLACDIVKSVGGQPSWDGSFDFLGTLAKQHGLIWGGDWGNPAVHHDFRDMDHLQRCSLAKQPGLFAGSWYPDAAYDPYTDKG